MTRLIVTGPLEALETFPAKDRSWAFLDVVRSCRLSPLELARTMTSRDEILLLEGWPADRDACSVVALGLWLGLPFTKLQDGQRVPCTPRSPVLEFVDDWTLRHGDGDAFADDLWAPAA